jgi:hypothetical protein
LRETGRVLGCDGTVGLGRILDKETAPAPQRAELHLQGGDDWHFVGHVRHLHMTSPAGLQSCILLADGRTTIARNHYSKVSSAGRCAGQLAFHHDWAYTCTSVGDRGTLRLPFLLPPQKVADSFNSQRAWSKRDCAARSEYDSQGWASLAVCGEITGA